MNSKVTKSASHQHPRSLADVDWFLHGKRLVGEQPIWKRCKSNWIVCPRIGVKITNIWNGHPVTQYLVHLKDQFFPKMFVQYCTYLYSKLQKAGPRKGAPWDFEDFGAHLVRKYIIPGSKSLPQYWDPKMESPKNNKNALKFRIIDGASKIFFYLHINGSALSKDDRLGHMIQNWMQLWTIDNYLGVSKNRGIPKWMVCNGKPY